MAAKKEGVGATIAKVAQNVLAFVADAALPTITERVDEVLDRIEARAIAAQHRFARQGIAYAFLALAVIAFLGALFYFLTDTLAVEVAPALLVVGVALLGASYGFHQQAARV
jgi:hypothetical protein